HRQGVQLRLAQLRQREVGRGQAALTVVAVVISVAVGFYGIYHRVASSRTEDTDLQDDSHIDKHYKVVLEQFRGFLRSLMMHAGVGTALGGVMTMVGEPQNLIIAKAAG
ncbi:hypothetical protein AAIH31_32925, partial [Pseudomonas aeruginosa]